MDEHSERNKNLRPRWLLVAALVLVMVGSSCGEGSDTSADVGGDVTGSADSDDAPAAGTDSSVDPGDGGETAAEAETTTSTLDTALEPSEDKTATTAASGTTTTLATTSTAPAEDDDNNSEDNSVVGANDPEYDPGLKPLVDQARADLAGRLGIGTGAIDLVSAELKVWPDSANGCPRSGMSYLQVLTDGAEMVFKAGGAQYRYTTGGQDYVPQLCEN